ncbi:MAG: hypothetical protein U0350_26065 [Caldilineaceae bacterium]
MLTDNAQKLIQLIHDHPARTVLVTTGAGAQAIADLLAVGGASRTVIEALVPYAQAAFDDFLGQPPEQYVAATTARLLAGRAYTRGRWLETGADPLIGLACTAAITSDRPKKGEHRAHIASWQPTRLVEYNLHLTKGARDRAGEETLVSALILNALATACGLEPRLALPLGVNDELTTQTYDFVALAEQLHQGERNFFGLHAHGACYAKNELPEVMLSGSFNPLHEGHLGLARVASELLGKPVAFELAAVNVDKPPLEPATVLNRIAQFAGRYAIFVSNAPTYLLKARLYPGVTFVVGYDTAIRIFDPRYYGGSVANMEAALAEIQQRGCKFLVAGRVDNAGKFRSLADLVVPTAFTELFNAIPAELFRHDISSTVLRTQGGRGSR